MRNKNTHSLTIKGKLDKKKGIFIAYSKLQFDCGKWLDSIEEIQEIFPNYNLEDFALGNSYTSDFVCRKNSGELMVRECIYRKNIMRPSTIKLLDEVRNYWLSRGVNDWGIVIDD